MKGCLGSSALVSGVGVSEKPITLDRGRRRPGSSGPGRRERVRETSGVLGRLGREWCGSECRTRLPKPRARPPRSSSSSSRSSASASAYHAGSGPAAAPSFPRTDPGGAPGPPPLGPDLSRPPWAVAHPSLAGLPTLHTPPGPFTRHLSRLPGPPGPSAATQPTRALRVLPTLPRPRRLQTYTAPPESPRAPRRGRRGGEARARLPTHPARPGPARVGLYAIPAPFPLPG